MGRYIGPKCKKSRREGEKLLLRGRCHSAKCGASKRNYPPGQHGPKGAPKLTGYGIQLRAKQKVKLIYGLYERQFSKYVRECTKMKGATGENLVKRLEERLDNVVYRAGYGLSRNMSRQLVSHRHIILNGKRVKTPSIRVKVGDEISIRENEKAKKFFDEIYKNKIIETPSWLSVDPKKHTIKVVAGAEVAKLAETLNTQLIVEFYSR